MTKQRLQTIKTVTTWSGVAITLCGIVLNLTSGGSWQGNSVSLVGLAITCCGHWATQALGAHQAAEKAADQKQIAELEDRVGCAEEFMNDPDLKRMVRTAASQYEIDHQDDGR